MDHRLHGLPRAPPVASSKSRAAFDDAVFSRSSTLLINSWLLLHSLLQSRRLSQYQQRLSSGTSPTPALEGRPAFKTAPGRLELLQKKASHQTRHEWTYTHVFTHADAPRFFGPMCSSTVSLVLDSAS